MTTPRPRPQPWFRLRVSDDGRRIEIPDAIKTLVGMRRDRDYIAVLRTGEVVLLPATEGEEPSPSQT